MIKYNELIENLFRYVQIDTQSSETSGEHPSTSKQRNLAEILSKELRKLGLTVEYDERLCYVYGFLEGNSGNNDAIGFISHMDTSPEVSGKNVKPRIIEKYDGNDSLLTIEKFPELKNHIGEDLIATDGTTLLGADDKAGISEIMFMLEYFQNNPQIKHRSIAVAFTPDEEIGAGTENFDLKKFKSKLAYTVDGGKYPIVEYECFNAAAATVQIHGVNVHTGFAKNVMINACERAAEFISLMPENEKPEYTSGYEGFFHLENMTGDVENCRLEYLIRDHDSEKFEDRKKLMQNTVDYLNKKYGKKIFEIKIRDQYKNMKEIIKDHFELVENAYKAIENSGFHPYSEAIRGGTDGASLSFRGLPCPNLPTGGYNYHSRYEYASIQEMEHCADLLISLAKI